MDAPLAELRGMPLLERYAAAGAASGAVVGSVVGLIVGLIVHPPTAWFATIEVGIPAGIAGGLVGCVAALIVMTGRRVDQGSTSSR
jgi:hypothetical protein